MFISIDQLTTIDRLKPVLTTGLVNTHIDRLIANPAENRSSGFPTRSHTNRVVKPLKIARGLKFCIKEGEEL